MKKLLVIFLFGIVSMGYGQIGEHNTGTESKNTLEYEQRNESLEVRTYVKANRNYIFEPVETGYIIISETKDGTQATIGKLRKTPNDENFYVLFYKDKKNPSYGRFDANGNFQSYTYDPIKDEVLEDNYTISNEATDPKNID